MLRKYKEYICRDPEGAKGGPNSEMFIPDYIYNFLTES